ncbi:unnamed protein product [Dicrocoelium dendriticum]|nr:unnamed protein product [Dicrocoelium dendriticum]
MPDRPSHHTDTDRGSECLSCRVVGFVLPVVLSAYVIYTAKDRLIHYTGVKRWSYLGLCASLSAGLLYIGGSQIIRRLD